MSKQLISTLPTEAVTKLLSGIVRDDIFIKLKKLHSEEDEMNKEMGSINKAILLLQNNKIKISKRISNNMKYRNTLINKL